MSSAAVGSPSRREPGGGGGALIREGEKGAEETVGREKWEPSWELMECGELKTG